MESNAEPITLETEEVVFDDFIVSGPTPKFATAPRILVAEDCPDTRMLLSHLLEHIGAEVTTVNDGKELVTAALNSVESGNPYNFLLVDIRMPELDGHSAVKLLRHRGYDGTIIAITSAPSLGVRYESIYSGCDFFLAKNSIANTIVPTIKAFL